MNWSYILFTKAQIFHDTIFSYRTDYLPEKYNENSIVSTKLTIDDIIQFMKNLSFFH